MAIGAIRAQFHSKLRKEDMKEKKEPFTVRVDFVNGSVFRYDDVLDILGNEYNEQILLVREEDATVLFGRNIEVMNMVGQSPEAKKD